MPEVLLGALVVALLVLLPATASRAVTETEPVCEPGSFEYLRDRVLSLPVITGVRITGLGDVCDGVAIGVQFLVNDLGDPRLPSEVYATSYSDEDPCTGEDLGPAGTARDGVLEVLLCENHPTAGYVPGLWFTQMRLISGDGTEVLGVVIERDPSGAPAAAPLPTPDNPQTGADAFRSAFIGALLVLLGIAMVRYRRSRQVAPGW